MPKYANLGTASSRLKEPFCSNSEQPLDVERPNWRKLGSYQREVQRDGWRSFVVGCSRRGGHKSAKSGKLAQGKPSPQGRGLRCFICKANVRFYPFLREQQIIEVDEVHI